VERRRVTEQKSSRLVSDPASASPTDRTVLAANLIVIKASRADRGNSERYRIPSQPPDPGGTGLLPRRRLSQAQYPAHCFVGLRKP